MGFWTRVRLPSIPFLFLRLGSVEPPRFGCMPGLFYFYNKGVAMDEKKFIVDQYLFETEEEYELALIEKKKIQFIDEHADYRTVETISLLYRKLVENDMMKTPVGYAYLERLREWLIRNGVKMDAFPNVLVKRKISMAGDKEIKRENRNLKRTVENGKRVIFILSAVCIGLVVVVVSLFALAYTDTHPNVLNYENALQNKYAAWEQEIAEREAAVRERERALEIDDLYD